jgi:hypothetical protein
MKTKQITEFDFHEFEKLAIETFGLMPDYSVVAAEEWSNDSDHLFGVDPIAELLDYERADLRGIYGAAASYQAAVAANGGVDPYAQYRVDNATENEAVKLARGRLWDVLNWNTRLLLEGLVEHGKIEPGEYNIAVCW